MKLKAKRAIPYPFVLEMLDGAGSISSEIHTRLMFGCTAIYVDEKIVLILRERETHIDDNGIWIATSREHHASLQRDFPAMRSIRVFESEGPTSWQNLPADSDDFESSAEKVCRLIIKGDPRIGKSPARKKPRRKSTHKTVRARAQAR